MTTNLNNQKMQLKSAYSNWLLEYMVYVYFALAFFEHYLYGALGNITKYYIFVVMAVVIFQFGFKIKIRSFHKLLLIWLCYQFLSLIWSDSLTIFRLNVLTEVGMVGLLIVLTMDSFDRKLIENIAIVMWTCSFLLSTLSIFLGDSYSRVLETRRVLVLFGQEVDPNNQAVFILIGISIAVYYLIYQSKFKVPAIITIFVNAIALFLTGSRGGLVSLIAIAAFVFLFNSCSAGIVTKVKKIVFFAVGLMLVIVALRQFIPDDILSRLTDVASYEGGSNRTTIWKNGLALLSEDLNIIFGAGWGSYFVYNGFNAAMHNTYLAMLCDVGIIGFLLFFIPIGKRVMYCIKNKEYLPVLLILSVFCPSFFIDSINKRFFWNAILFLFMYVLCKKKEEQRENKVHNW